MKIKYLAFLIVICFSKLYAQESYKFSNDTVYVNCDSLNTQFELNQCSGENVFIAQNIFYNTWHKVLDELQKRKERVANDTIEDSLKKVFTEDEARLSKAILENQDKWKDYYETSLHIPEILYNGGSMMPMQVSGCKRYLLQQRIKELNFLLEDLTR